MRKILVSFVAIISILLLTACGSNKIVGTWVGHTQDGLETTFIFEKDGTFKYDNEYGFNSEGKYTIKDNIITIELKSWSAKKEYKFAIKNNKLDLTATDQYSPSYKGMEKRK